MKRFAVFACALAALSGWQSGWAQSTFPPGCDSGRSAAAFHSDGSAADPSGAPIVCTGLTGFGGAETRVAVGPNGDVVVAPATVNLGLLGLGNVDYTPTAAGPKYQAKFFNTSAIVVSRDQGASWEFVKPDGKFVQDGDHALYFDRTNGRLHFLGIFGSAPTPGVNAQHMQTQAFASPGASSSYTDWDTTTMSGYVSEKPSFHDGSTARRVRPAGDRHEHDLPVREPHEPAVQ